MGRSRATMPTKEQQRLIASRGLVASCWLVIGDSDQELRIVHRFSGSTWKIRKNSTQNFAERGCYQ